MLHIGFCNALLNLWVLYIRIVVRSTFLLRGPRGVADDNLNRELLLTLGAFVVLWEPFSRKKRRVFCFVEIEGIGEDDAVEGFLATIFPASPTENLLNINRGDVVGEKDEFIGVELIAVFAFKIVGLDKIGL